MQANDITLFKSLWNLAVLGSVGPMSTVQPISGGQFGHQWVLAVSVKVANSTLNVNQEECMWGVWCPCYPTLRPSATSPTLSVVVLCLWLSSCWHTLRPLHSDDQSKLVCSSTFLFARVNNSKIKGKFGPCGGGLKEDMNVLWWGGGLFYCPIVHLPVA